MANRRSLLDDLEALFGGQSNAQQKRLCTWQSFLEKTGNDLDKRLMAHAKKEGLIYIGGKCRFTATSVTTGATTDPIAASADEKAENMFIVNVDAELYYKDQFKTEKNFQLYPLHTEKSFSEFDMHDAETAQQLEKLKTEQFEMMVEKPEIHTETEES